MTYLANCEAVVFHNKNDINRLLNVLQDITILICVRRCKHEIKNLKYILFIP